MERESVEQMCQRIFEARGYIVIGRWEPCEIGEVLDGASNRRTMLDPLKTPLVVTSVTDEADMITQEYMMVGKVPNPDSMPYYYRVVAE